MTFNGRPGRPVVVSTGDRGGTVHVVARDRDDGLIHLREDFFGKLVNRLPGRLAGDPTAVVSRVGTVHVFARGRLGHLLHYRWDRDAQWPPVPNVPREAFEGALVGPIDRGWRIAYDPVAVAWPDNGIAVYVRGAEDLMLRWSSPDDGVTWTEEARHLGGFVTSDIAVIQRPFKGLELLAADQSGLLRRWGPIPIPSSGLLPTTSENPDPTSRLTSAPVVVSWAPDRLDVLATTEERPSDIVEHWTMSHWGLDEFPRRRWFGPDEMTAGTATRPTCVVTTAVDHGEAFGRDSAKDVVRWSWDDDGFFLDPVGWKGPEVIATRTGSEPAAAVFGSRTHVFFWDLLGANLREAVRDGTTWSERLWEVSEPEEFAELLPSVPVTADVLLRRPEDLVVLGVGWSGFDLAPGTPPTLVRQAGADALVDLTLPPQHVAEEVVPGDQQAEPSIPGGQVSPFGMWRSALSGPSRLVYEVTATEIPLTTEGVLAALQGARLRTADAGTGEPRTRIELPWQLFVSADGATTSHPVTARASAAGGVPLWRTRTHAPNGLSVHEAGPVDPFPLPLGATVRGALAAQGTPAALHRLELSALGGTLSVHGAWDGLDWQHETRLGRDHRVRVTMRGLLYPFGHVAEYVEVTERSLAEPGEPIGVLRKRVLLRVLEPTRAMPADPLLRRTFPFDSVTIGRTLVTDLRDPDDPQTTDWVVGVRQRKAPEDLLARLDQRRIDLAETPVPPGPFENNPPIVERYVHASEHDPGSEIAFTQSQLALSKIFTIEAILDLQQQIAAVLDTEAQTVPRFFCPRHPGGQWVEFPVVCTSGATAVSFGLPLIFVVDHRYPETPTMQAYDTLVDDGTPEALAQRWATLLRVAPNGAVDDEQAPAQGRPDESYAGVVSAGGVALDLIRGGRPEDVQVVQRVNLVGTFRDRVPQPRLGPAPGAAVLGPTWGLELTLPALQTLLPDDPRSHLATVRFSPEYEAQGAAVDVALHIVPTLPGLSGIPVDFTRTADRSGGLTAPNMVADGISRTAGPVSLAGLDPPDPATLFGDATVLGFPLKELLPSLPSGTAPSITTDMSGPQPVVTLAWPTTTLATPAGSPLGRAKVVAGDELQETGPQPTIELTVQASGNGLRTSCTISDFSLSFPTGKPLLILNLRTLRFVQEPGRQPAVRISGLDAMFSNELKILKALQEGVQLGDRGPLLTVDDQGVVASYTLPVGDVGSGAFAMRNLTFHAEVVVPFQGDPVTVAVAFASKAKPFTLTVMMLGGGGYLDIEVAHTGLRRLDISLEFGASIFVDFTIASGEAHVLGGVRFELLPDQSVQVTGYLRIGGSLEILGLVSVSVELLLTLGYRTAGNRLVGRATLVIEIDLTIYADSIELDSGEWTISGDDPPSTPPSTPSPSPDTLASDPYADLWRAHRAAHEPAPTP